MSERLSCLIDDPIFENISTPQWLLYAELISDEQNNKFEYDLSMIEYLASFWNSKDVKKIKEARNNKRKHKFKNDKEFIEDVKTGTFKQKNEVLEAITKIRQAQEEAKKHGNGKSINGKEPLIF